MWTPVESLASRPADLRCTRQTLSIHIWQVAEMGVARSQRTPQRMTMQRGTATPGCALETC